MSQFKFIFPFLIFPIVCFAEPVIIEKYIHQKKFQLEMVSEPADLKQGLSDRIFLPNTRGMLFIFPKEEQQFFWMHRMHFDLDMLWLDKNCRIVAIFRDQKPCEKNDICPIITSLHPAKYVLEVNSKTAPTNKLKVNDRLEICPK